LKTLLQRCQGYLLAFGSHLLCHYRVTEGKDSGEEGSLKLKETGVEKPS
jgi:hypothetical protein